MLGTFTTSSQQKNKYGLSIYSCCDRPFYLSSRFAHNKARMAEGSEQAGMILGFGLNGILSSMPPTLRHEYLAQENSFTTMAMLLGLCANLAGT